MTKVKRKIKSWKMFKKKGNRSATIIVNEKAIKTTIGKVRHCLIQCDRCMTIYKKIGIFPQMKYPERRRRKKRDCHFDGQIMKKTNIGIK